MEAGFAKACITPPIGTRMEGFGDLQRDPNGAAAIHDDLFVRALYCRHDTEQALVLAYDLLQSYLITLPGKFVFLQVLNFQSEAKRLTGEKFEFRNPRGQ